MELNPDFQEFLRSFVGHDVRFLIVGGYALAAHGHPRYTKDLDVWVWTDPSNSQRVVAAVEEFGFSGLGLTAADFEDPDVVVQLGREPQRALAEQVGRELLPVRRDHPEAHREEAAVCAERRVADDEAPAVAEARHLPGDLLGRLVG